MTYQMKEYFVTALGLLLVVVSIPWGFWGFRKAREKWAASLSPGWMLIKKMLEEVFIYPTEFFTHTFGPVVVFAIGVVLTLASLNLF